MTVPPITGEQRRAALQKAAVVRIERANCKERLKSGDLSVPDALRQAENDPVLGKLRVSEFLASLPRIGPVNAAAMMEEFSIAPSRRLGGLGHQQRKKLLARFTKETHVSQ